MQKTEKRRTGRPKEKLEEKIDFGIIKRYAELGFTTNEELAYLLDVSVRTIANYKNDPAFLALLQKGIHKADSEVVKALHKRACGFTFEEKTAERKHGKMVTIKIVTKYCAPDATACNSWLNNRRRHQWAWSPKPSTGLEDEQINALRKLAIEAMCENS